MMYVIQFTQHHPDENHPDDTSRVAYVCPQRAGTSSRKPVLAGSLTYAKTFSNQQHAVQEAKRLIRFCGLTSYDPETDSYSPNGVRVVPIRNDIRVRKVNVRKPDPETIPIEIILLEDEVVYPVERVLKYMWGDHHANDGSNFYTIRLFSEKLSVPWYVQPGSDMHDNGFKHSREILDAVKYTSAEMAREALDFYLKNTKFGNDIRKSGYTVDVVQVTIPTVKIYKV